MGWWLKIVGYVASAAGLVLFVLYALLFDVWTVPTDDPALSASIEPTLTAGDVVLLSRNGSVDRSELVRCADPQAPGRYVVARAIARAGEKIALDEETATIDGQRTASPHACEPPTVTLRDPNTNEDDELLCSIEDLGGTEFSVLRSRQHPEAPTKATVQTGRWFLVSDDRHIHVDSRDYGQIDPRTCKHIVFRVVSAAGFSDTKTRLSIIW
jgi:signal peptidase I